MSNILVYKSNNLVEAGYKLSLNEQRLILSAIAQIDSRKVIPKDNTYEITAEEFSKNFGIQLNQAYRALEEASSRLYERDIKTFDRTENSRTRFRWVDGVKYWDGEAKVSLSFSNKIIPYLARFHEQFTKYELKQICKLQTAYAIRLYELLVQFINTKEKERYISLKELREFLELENVYPRFFDIKKRIIEPSIKEINESTDLTVDWDIVKKGRVITGLMFAFQKTPQTDS